MNTLRAARRSWSALVFLLPVAVQVHAQSASAPLPHLLDKIKLAREHFSNDAPWFANNIPFLEIDDPEIERVYYYRWRLYRAHMRKIGAQGTDETEFLDDVPWARHPYTDLNDSSAFHILEGRWLRNPAHVESLVDHLYAGGGNDRHFSESIAAATYAWTQVTGNPAPALRHLDAMQQIYNLWDDHFDARRNLYWIEPLRDATEYTISSIDASGAGFTDTPSTRDNENGFTGGMAFRPSINAYQFGNANAIASLAALAGKPELAAQYTRRAEALRTAMVRQLWNPQLNHFTDIYQRSTPTVTAGTFIRGRELVGYVPWMYDLPPRTAPTNGAADFNIAWKHALDPSELAGAFGLRTVEPSYPRYLHQYRYDRATGLAECQWNGPSWPFQTSQALTAMANLLRDYQQNTVTAADYVHLLRQYTHQHLLGTGTLDLQEDYNPDTGKPIVGLPRSHHYNHSTYIDLVISGLLGIRPHQDDVLEIDPLLPQAGSAEQPIRYFALQDLRYHGHDISVVYDQQGSHYGLGAGLSVFSDKRRIYGPKPLQHVTLALKRGVTNATAKAPHDVAVNVWVRAPSSFEPDLPIASGSPNTDNDHLYEVIDGRTWFFPEIPNGWSPTQTSSTTEHSQTAAQYAYTVDLRHPATVSSAEVFFFSDGTAFQPPTSYSLQALINGTWTTVAGQKSPLTPIANGTNETTFAPLQAQQFRLLFSAPAQTRIRLVEFKLFAAPN